MIEGWAALEVLGRGWGEWQGGKGVRLRGWMLRIGGNGRAVGSVSE